MTRKERYARILEHFRSEMPTAQSELHFDGAYQLLVAVMLSAQCTDKRVNLVTPALFEAFPTPRRLAAASFDEVYGYVKSVSYPNSKTNHLIEAARMICDSFGGEVPGTVEELMTLPGVGRKTANVVTSVLFDNPVIAVDTHVFRVSHRLGLSDGKTPLEVEKDLEKNIPVEDRATAHHWLILHGRYVCKAVKPGCGDCALAQWCRTASSRA